MVSSLNYAEFYVMNDPLGNQALRLDFGTEMEWMKNDIAWALYRGQLQVTDKLINLKGYMGRRPMDVLWSGFPPLQCISDRVVELLTESKVSGWSTYPVTVLDRDLQPLPGYLGFAVTGRGGAFDRSMSQVITKPAPGKSYQVYKGFSTGQ